MIVGPPRQSSTRARAAGKVGAKRFGRSCRRVNIITPATMFRSISLPDVRHHGLQAVKMYPAGIVIRLLFYPGKVGHAAQPQKRIRPNPIRRRRRDETGSVSGGSAPDRRDQACLVSGRGGDAASRVSTQHFFRIFFFLSLAIGFTRIYIPFRREIKKGGVGAAARVKPVKFFVGYLPRCVELFPPEECPPPPRFGDDWPPPPLLGAERPIPVFAPPPLLPR